MYEFTLPNYKDNNIVNLMSSISNSFGKKHDYNELTSLDHKELQNFNNIVLIVIDGLGYNYLKKQKNSFLFKHLHSKLTTTFLSSTACANTVFHVGYPPQQHALTGWTVNIKEAGGITEVLHYDEDAIGKNNYPIEKIIESESLHKGFNGKCFTVIKTEKAKRDYFKYVARETEIIPAETYRDIFLKLEELINENSKDRRFIHAYLDDFDSLEHLHGTDGEKLDELFNDIDKGIRTLSESVSGTNTKMIIVSDHGLINIPRESEINIKDIPGFEECLEIPMTGELRARNCFIKQNKIEDFKKIIESKMSQHCWCFEGGQLVKDNFYGLGVPNEKLLERVGDFVLIMKENYILLDKPSHHESKDEKSQTGSHGSLTEDEMNVPLIIVDC